MAKTPSTPSALPSRDQELALHGRLLARDHTATADLAAAYLTPLICWLEARSRRRAVEFCGEAASEALCALMKNPESYDPGRGKDRGLFAYLQMSASGDLKNRLRKEERHHRLRKSWQAVEEGPRAGKYLARDDDPSLPMRIHEEAAEALTQVLPSVRAGLSETELRGLDLLLGGEKKSAVYAAACGFEHLPQEQQRGEVKRLKDKLTRRLQRARPADEQ